MALTLALLPMSPVVASAWSFLSSLDETLDVIDRSGRGARIAFDVYHLWQEPRLLERIPEVAPHVAVVQLSDSPGTPRSEYDRCRPGDGRIPLTSIVHAFDEAGYDGYYELAIWSRGALESRTTPTCSANAERGSTSSVAAKFLCSRSAASRRFAFRRFPLSGWG